MTALPVPGAAPDAVRPVGLAPHSDDQRPLLHRTELAGRDPRELVEGQVDDDGSKGCTAYLHVGRLCVAVDIDQPHDAEAMLETAKVFDRVMVAAAQVATQLRDTAASVCEQCGGFGWHTDSRDVDHPCHACATTGRI